MPRDTVAIPLSSVPTYEAAAEFFSHIAYPDPIDATEREKYRIALSRWAVLERANLDKAWGRATHQIRPIIFSQPEKLFSSVWDRGTDLLIRRIVCATLMIMPHVSGNLEELEGLSPTVGNTALVIGRCFGYAAESQKTVESQIWAPTKPVSHAATVFVWWNKVSNELAKEGPWDQEHKLCEQNSVLAALFYADVMKMILQESEKLRLRLPGLGNFHVREEDTIQFIAD
jgi:hypothetical protein